MLLVYGEPSGAASLDPAVVAAEYEAWGRGLAAQGVGVTGNELAPDRIVMGDTGGDPGGATLGGYFLLSTEPDVDVQSLVEDHPHVRYGGRIEIAPIMRRN